MLASGGGPHATPVFCRQSYCTRLLYRQQTATTERGIRVIIQTRPSMKPGGSALEGNEPCSSVSTQLKGLNSLACEEFHGVQKLYLFSAGG